MITPSFSLTATERVLPSFAVDFTTAILDPNITVSRALNTATCVGSNGYIQTVNANLPRFYYDPATLICKGILSEPTRANIIKFNNTFVGGSTVWSSSATLTAGADTGPDNTASATSLVKASASYIYVQLTTTAQQYTFSVYLKANGTTACVLTNGDLGGTVGATGTVNLTAKTITVANIGTTTGSTGTLTDAGNGWYRATLTTTATAISTWFCNIGSSGAVNILVAFPQFEAGAFATSYISNPTSGTTTRNADVVTVVGKGVVAQGSYVLDATIANGSTLLTSGSVTFAATASTEQKTAVSYDTNSVNKSVNGAAVTSSAGATASADITIGTGGLFKNFAFYLPKLTNSELQAFSK